MTDKFHPVVAANTTGYSDYVRAAKGHNGVYIIRSKKTQELVYIGYSGSNVYKALTRHFQAWKDPTQARTVYSNKDGFEVRIILTRTAKRAENLERALIIKYRPRDNPNKLENYTEKDFTRCEKKELKSFLEGVQVEPHDDIPF